MKFLLAKILADSVAIAASVVVIAVSCVSKVDDVMDESDARAPYSVDPAVTAPSLTSVIVFDQSIRSVSSLM